VHPARERTGFASIAICTRRASNDVCQSRVFASRLLLAYQLVEAVTVEGHSSGRSAKRPTIGFSTRGTEEESVDCPRQRQPGHRGKERLLSAAHGLCGRRTTEEARL